MTQRRITSATRKQKQLSTTITQAPTITATTKEEDPKQKSSGKEEEEEEEEATKISAITTTTTTTTKPQQTTSSAQVQEWDIYEYTEGIENISPKNVVYRKEIISFIVSAIKSQKFSIALRGPPMSGKTSLFQLICKIFEQPHLFKDMKEAILLHRSFSSCKYLSDPGEYIPGLLREEKKPEDLPQLLLIDECSSNLGPVAQFNADFKQFSGFGTRKRKYVLICAFVYKQTSIEKPLLSANRFVVEILPLRQSKTEVPGIFFTTNECIQLAENDEKLGNFIYNLTAGHPGMVRATFEYLKLNSEIKYPPEYLTLKPEFAETIEKLRFFYSLDFKDPAYKQTELRQAIQALLKYQSIPDTISSTREYFLRRGLMNEAENSFCSPLVRQAIIHKITTLPAVPSCIQFDNFDNFIITAMTKIDRCSLNEGISTVASGLPSESHINNLLVLACANLGVHVFSEVGRCFGISDRADIWVDGKRDWLIELMRSDYTQKKTDILNNEQEHLDRLDKEKGVYGKLPWRKAIVLHFHFYNDGECPKRSASEIQKNLWIVDVNVKTQQFSLSYKNDQGNLITDANIQDASFDGKRKQAEISTQEEDDEEEREKKKTKKELDPLFANNAQPIDIEWMKKVSEKFFTEIDDKFKRIDLLSEIISQLANEGITKVGLLKQQSFTTFKTYKIPGAIAAILCKQCGIPY